MNSSLQDVFYPTCPWKAGLLVRDHVNTLASLSPTVLPSLGLQEALSLIMDTAEEPLQYFISFQLIRTSIPNTTQSSSAMLQCLMSQLGALLTKKEAALHDGARSRASLPHFRLMNLCPEAVYGRGARSWSTPDSGMHRAEDQLLPYVHFLPRNEVSPQRFAPWTEQHAPAAGHNTKPSTSFLFPSSLCHHPTQLLRFPRRKLNACS